MLNRKITIIAGILIVALFAAGVGGYYYYYVVKPSQATQNSKTNSNSSSNTTKTDAQIQNEKLKDTVIQNSSTPAGIATPNYVAAPTPPSK